MEASTSEKKGDTMYQLLSSILVAAFLAAAAPGPSPKLTTSWKAPDADKLNFTKIVVAFLTSDADLRNRVEGGLARRIARSVPANTIVPDADVGNREAVKAHLVKNAIDGALVVRLVDLKNDWVISEGQQWYAGMPHYWDTWDSTYLRVNSSSYAFQEKIVTADIVLYSVATAKPVWIGRFKSTNPKHLRGLLDELVKDGAEELKKQKLI
jgi:hypothetical protein